MIREISYKDFVDRNIQRLKKGMTPQSCQFELTYKCPYNCIHCYCKCFDKEELINNELSYDEIVNILDQVYNEGCIYLTLTGGEPLIRPDFVDIYRYAKKKGFLISLFTNGFLLSQDMVTLLKETPPYNIEITINGVTESTYEGITQKRGSFNKVTEVIKSLVESKIPLVLKSNGLHENKDEILKIKSFTEDILGKKRYKFDSFITPALDGSLKPCQHRLEPEEIIEIERSDPDMIEQKTEGYKHRDEKRLRNKELLYQCNAWEGSFYITPHGRLRFCYLSDEFSSDLRKVSFREGFYNVFPKIREVPFYLDTECKNCQLFDYCYQCPARSFLETGKLMEPVSYFCRLAKIRSKEERVYVDTGSTA